MFFLRKEIDELKEQLASQTLTETLLSQALKQANEEKRNWRLEACLQQKHLEIKLEKNRLDIEDQEREKMASVSCKIEVAQDIEIKTSQKDKVEVITIDDTSEDEDTKERLCNQTESKEVNITNLAMNDTGISIKDIKSETFSETIKVKENKENEVDNFENEAVEKRVTFASNSVSPKKSNLRKCKKVIICKPMSFSTIQKPK